MVQITGGKVSFSRTVQVSQYEPAKADVTLDFIVPEGVEFTDQLNIVAQIAQAKALEMISGKMQAPKPAPKQETKEPAPEKLKTPKEQAAQNMNERAEKAAAQKENAPKTPPKQKPTSVPSTGQQISSGEDRAPDDDLSDVLGGAEPITDKDLIAEINKAAATLVKTMKDAAHPAIRKLIAEFAGPLPKRATDIPQDKRHEFVEKLKTLDKA